MLEKNMMFYLLITSNYHIHSFYRILFLDVIILQIIL